MSGQTTPIDLAGAVIARLTDRLGSSLDIKGDTDFARLVAEKRLPVRLPAAFVVATGFSAQSQRRVGAISHDVHQGVSVVLVTGHAGDASGRAAQAASWPAQLAVIQALAGWPPAPGYAALALAEGRLQGLGGAGQSGAVAVTISFSTEWKFHAREAS